MFVTRTIEVEAGSGNVLPALGLSDPEERLAKADLAIRIAAAIRAQRLTQARAARVLNRSAQNLSFAARATFRFLHRTAHALFGCVARTGCRDHCEACAAIAAAGARSRCCDCVRSALRGGEGGNACAGRKGAVNVEPFVSEIEGGYAVKMLKELLVRGAQISAWARRRRFGQLNVRRTAKSCRKRGVVLARALSSKVSL